jgi:hypothetical protein
MINTDFLYGMGCSLVLLAIGEGIALLLAYNSNRKLKIAKIAEDAHDAVEKMSDDELKKQLKSDVDA